MLMNFVCREIASMEPQRACAARTATSVQLGPDYASRMLEECCEIAGILTEASFSAGPDSGRRCPASGFRPDTGHLESLPGKR
jgi:hypothetical protein